jgi:hypothetical protein
MPLEKFNWNILYASSEARLMPITPEMILVYMWNTSVKSLSYRKSTFRASRANILHVTKWVTPTLTGTRDRATTGLQIHRNVTRIYGLPRHVIIAATYNKAVSYVSPPSCLTAGHWSMHTWIRDSGDVSTNLLTKCQGLYDNSHTAHTVYYS